MKREKIRPALVTPAPESRNFPARILAPAPREGKGNLEEILAADLVDTFRRQAREVDVVKLGLAIADLARQREQAGA